jgi:hypothetical protein
MKKKILIALFALLLVVGVIGTFWGSDIAEASSSLWNSCPKGKINDYYPGDCHDYIDTNADSICDRSQSNPQAAVTTTPSIISTAVVPTAALIAGDITTAAGTGTASSASSNNSKSYYFIPIAVVCIVLYGASWILSAAKKIKTLTHRKIWNVVLGISMVGSTVLGLIRILIKDYDMAINLPFNTLFWHVEISIILGVVGLFHIIWHWRYFAKLLGTSARQES